MRRLYAVLLCSIAFILISGLAAATFPADKSTAVAQPEAKFAYHKAPGIIHDVLNSPASPTVVVSPTHDFMLIVDSRRHPTIADLAQPMLRIAGLRIDPSTDGRHHPTRYFGLHVLNIATDKEQKVALPSDAWISTPEWSYDGRHFVFTNITAHGIELWVGDAQTGSAHKIPGVIVNSAYEQILAWMPDNRTLLVETVRANRGVAPSAPKVPIGPNAQESAGKAAPIPTFEDLLKDAHDEDLFDYYCTGQLALVDWQSGKVKPIGKPAIFDDASPSPDGKHFLVVRLHKPYSHLLPAGDFPRTIEVWDASANVEHSVADLPSNEGVPLEGVPTGPRSAGWRATAPATLVWVEALDGGNSRAKVPFHDRVVMLSAPFSGEPTEIVKLRFRHKGGAAGPLTWGEKFALVSDYDRASKSNRMLLIDPDSPSQAPRVIFDLNSQDFYNDPGTPVMHRLRNGAAVIVQNGNSIYLKGEGASPKGDFPFLARFDLTTLKSERIFQSPDGSYESFIALLSNDASKFITRSETPIDPPNYFLRTLGSNDKRALTQFPDPAPQLRGITKKLITYKRDDDVALSFTLYLPADYKPGTRLPTILWAYPVEYSDIKTASQVTGVNGRPLSQYSFTSISGISELFLATQGYAVLENASIPVVGDPDTVNNTYVDQITAGAKAAIDKAVELGVTDRNRVGVGGHSYGAFMTANLIAHTNLFKAGVARSGAYNRTLTPFGFQSERRTFWQAPDVYMKMSPFSYADKFQAPILLIHGEADDNPGTFPIQSDRLYQAIKGNGGIVRYVTLPFEAHGYIGLESVEHMHWEMVQWFDRWVKNASGTASVAAK